MRRRAKMFRLAAWIAVLVPLALPAATVRAAPRLSSQTDGPAQSTCSDATLSGAYDFEGSGVLFVDSNRQPVSLSGTVDLDGAGNGSGQVQLTFGSATPPEPLPDIRYSVNGNCTGTVDAEGGFRATLVIVDGGQEIDLREADDFGAITGVARPLSGDCNATPAYTAAAVCAGTGIVQAPADGSGP